MTDKSLGQHWLFDEVSLAAVREGCGMIRGDSVLEIGPGLGTLTDRLLQHGAKVTAVEFDKKLAAELRVTFEGYITEHQLTVVNDDILQFDFTSMPRNYLIAANIPYYLTSHLLRLLCDTPNKPKQASLLMQKEVAERVAANAGNLSVLSVFVQLYYDVSLGDLVPAELFVPVPKVDSQILILQRRNEPLFADLDMNRFTRIVKAGFSERRKKLRSSLSSALRMSKQAVENWCREAGIDPHLRAQALTLQQWHDLYTKEPHDSQ